MTYQKKLYSRINNSEMWPKFYKPDFLADLNNLANEAYAKKTTEGYLAALLIYHQLCEEMIKILIQCSNFFMQCAVFPNEIKTISFKREMFGQLIGELKRGVSNTEIKKFIEKCEDLNNLRIKMVHKITLKTSIRSIADQSKKAKKKFDDLCDIFIDEYDKYRVTFHNYEKNSEDWLDELDEKSKTY
ncbi:MAG: hypothetical protein PHO48_04095 [Candidatus Gracilibacteria bacterium]|nr:hypothetical protein [Candidatus Gracilibacteria bacterium]